MADLEKELRQAQAQIAVLTEAHALANELNRSAWSIAERNGQNTNWEAFRQRLRHALETSHEAFNSITVRGR